MTIEIAQGIGYALGIGFFAVLGIGSVVHLFTSFKKERELDKLHRKFLETSIEANEMSVKADKLMYDFHTSHIEK